MTSNWLLVRDRLLATLSQAQKKRAGVSVTTWINYERQVMLTAVNDERQARGLPSASIDDIATRDGWAAGHSDYSSKFALYCAELACGLERGR